VEVKVSTVILTENLMYKEHFLQLVSMWLPDFPGSLYYLVTGCV
jgi:hypothetical protein